eukprot:CAMPEP_0198154804 /NCGR_PEP_ID=MMETSP1443-20131203/68800_1 /TAXON_ID=186043 /ORGANISM="Entomoneis sp., Strain CCMP2396" /LENGTH=277 /DNA_ID=CAMNT_0043821517 /DNA_START=25 /DNA_END=858 /DNA_ORIENTATION=-
MSLEISPEISTITSYCRSAAESLSLAAILLDRHQGKLQQNVSQLEVEKKTLEDYVTNLKEELSQLKNELVASQKEIVLLSFTSNKKVNFLAEIDEDSSVATSTWGSQLEVEKKTLEDYVTNLKEELSQLKNELVESQKEIVLHSFTSNKKVNYLAETDEESSFASSMTGHSQSQQQSQQDRFFHQGQESIENMKKQLFELEIEITEPQDSSHSDDASTSQSSTNQFFLDTEEYDAVNKECLSSSGSKQKNRLSKRCSSPKKWRRMMRTHRLQSIVYC